MNFLRKEGEQQQTCTNGKCHKEHRKSLPCFLHSAGRKDNCRNSFLLPVFMAGAREPLLSAPRLSRRYRSELGTQTSSRLPTLSSGTFRNEFCFATRLHLLPSAGKTQTRRRRNPSLPARPGCAGCSHAASGTLGPGFQRDVCKWTAARMKATYKPAALMLIAAAGFVRSNYEGKGYN